MNEFLCFSSYAPGTQHALFVLRTIDIILLTMVSVFGFAGGTDSPVHQAEMCLLFSLLAQVRKRQCENH